MILAIIGAVVLLISCLVIKFKDDEIRAEHSYKLIANCVVIGSLLVTIIGLVWMFIF